MDEVGRGTATYDGIAVATAVAEYIAKKVKARTLFATHYHELTELENKVEGIVNYHMEVKETHDGKIEFLYTLKRGPSNKSFGVVVAKMAGLPEEVVKRAEEILKTLEGERKDEIQKLESPKQEPVWKTDGETEKVEEEKQTLKVENIEELKKFEEIKKLLQEVDIAKTTPLEALLKLAKLKEMI